MTMPPQNPNAGAYGPRGPRVPLPPPQQAGRPLQPPAGPNVPLPVRPNAGGPASPLPVTALPPPAGLSAPLPPPPALQPKKPHTGLIIGAIVAIAALLVIVVVAVSGGGGGGGGGGGESDTTARTASGPYPPVQDGKYTFTVESVRSGLSSFHGAEPTGTFTVVRVTVANTGNAKMEMIPTDMQRLVTSDNQKHSVIPEQILGSVTQEIKPGAPVTFDFVYDIPVGARPVAIDLYGGRVSTQGATVSFT